MSGLRVRHATERNCVLTLVDGRRVLSPPHLCGVCLRSHDRKTYHIRLDDQGAAIVSREIWQRLSVMPSHGSFTLVGPIAKPPPQTTSINRSVSFSGAEMAEVPKGVMVRHPTLRNQRFVVVDPTRPYPVPHLCSVCSVAHRAKTYHLTLDGEGAVTVSPEVAEAVERLGMSRAEQPKPVRLVHAT